jgi:hypothetical protein
MSIVSGAAKQASTRGFYPKNINGSLRFNDDDLPYLEQVSSAPTDGKKFTFSCWVKRSRLGGEGYIFSGYNGTNYDRIVFDGSNRLHVEFKDGSSTTFEQHTTAVFRDVSAWYHIVVEFDSTQAQADRVKMYVNGVQQTQFDINTELTTSNYTTKGFNADGKTQWIGVYDSSNTNPIYFFDGYLAEVHFTDGTAYDADAFGEFKNGVWVAKTPDVTYGTNGFYLDFQDDTEVEAFNTVLYRGNGATQSITGMGFQPDLVWIKNRDQADNHVVHDTVRGSNLRLETSTTVAEGANTNWSSFDSDGFTLANAGGSYNTSGESYVAWGWKAGDSNVSNTDGSITSTVRANDTYGFSIVSWTGNATSGATVGHGLSSTPVFWIIKNRDNGTPNWMVGSAELTNPDRYKLHLNNNEAQSDWGSALWQMDSSVITLDAAVSHINGNNEKMIAYCWAEKTGYSKFGSYTGSTAPNSITGLGFEPAWLMIKRTDSGQQWGIVDNTRKVTNPKDNALFAESSQAESPSIYNTIDFDSDGFTLNTNDQWSNASGGTYIYAAFADTREAAFWLDQSGNDNDWQPVNLDHNDTVADSPTDNFATLNPLDKLGSPTLSDGNLKVVMAYNTDVYIRGTHGINSGKWYWEVTCGSVGSNAGIAINPITTSITAGSGAQFTGAYAYEADGRKRIGITASSYGASYTSGDVIGVAVDFDALEIEFYKNNVSQGAISISEGTYLPASSTGGAAESTFTFNFGQQPFKYDPPA